MLYDPSDHTKVVIDHSEAAQQAETKAFVDQRMGAVIDRARASGTEAGDATADGMQQVVASGLLNNFSRDPAKRAQQRAEIKRIMADAQAAHGVAPTNLIANGQPLDGGQPGEPSAVDQLTKLADLHDRGVLTDAEFDRAETQAAGGVTGTVPRTARPLQRRVRSIPLGSDRGELSDRGPGTPDVRA